MAGFRFVKVRAFVDLFCVYISMNVKIKIDGFVLESAVSKISR